MPTFTSAAIVNYHCKPAKPIVIKIRIVKATFSIPIVHIANTQQLLSASNHAVNMIVAIQVPWVVLVEATMVDAISNNSVRIKI